MIYLNPRDQPICKYCGMDLFKVPGTKIGYICGKCGTQYSKAKPPKLKPEAPPDYCHESDHGSREEEELE